MTETSNASSLLRYSSGEVPVPSGFTEKDMDWMAFAWVLERQTANGWMFAQLMITPGVVLFRNESSSVGDPEPLNPGVPYLSYKLHQRMKPEQNMVAVAEDITKTLLQQGYVHNTPFFPCDFTDSETHQNFHGMSVPGAGRSVETLGELIVHGDMLSMQSIFDHVAHARIKKLWKPSSW